jgi:Fe-S oxidoreductase
MTDTTIEKLKKNRVVSCLECGKCTAVCPISRFNDSYSPRRLVTQGLFYGMDDLISDKLLWSCLTCLLCSRRCPVDVRYSEYMRDVRAEAHDRGYWGTPSHGGALHHIMEIAAAPDLKQHRTDWITDDLKTKATGEVLYFVGCLPYHEALFGKDLAMSPISIARDTVRILNRLGIEPVVLDNERCCGHDLYWLGQLDKFDSLGRLNLQEIERAGAKTVVTACPECALTLKQLYAMRRAGVGFQVKHISEVIAESVDELKLNPVEAEVSFQDPCRLGRYLNDYDSPRTVLASIPGLTLHEMAHSGPGAICCGTTNWMNCDATSRQIQRSRLAEAKATGAQTLVTACPKCQIHFRCSGCGDESEKIDIEVTDLVNVVASAMGD